MIVVCGEALIDLVPTGGPEPGALVPRPGGGPFNTAVALGRLGVPTAFFGRLSTDAFGRRLRAELINGGVDVGWVASGAEPTTLAVVELTAAGDAAYHFYIEGTADRLLSNADLPDPLPGAALAYHFGTLSLVTEPGASTLLTLMRRARAAGRVVAVDPNIRPALLPDRAEYRARVDAWIAHADVVKVSAADLGWLYPGERSAMVVDRWLTRGVSVVVITDGAAGATAAGPGGSVTVPAPQVSVVDTIGAGDAFNAGLLAWLYGSQLLSPGQLSRLDSDALAEATSHASHIAALTVTRRGADPPWHYELR